MRKSQRTSDAQRGLRIGLQTVGVYFLCTTVIELFDTISRVVYYKLSQPPNAETYGQNLFRATVMEHLIAAAARAIPAWVLLVKTDWAVRVASNVSIPQSDSESEESILSE